MLKHFAAAALGFAIVFGAIGPASAGKGHYGFGRYKSPYMFSNSGPAFTYNGPAQRYSRKPQPNIRLDLETESVWRNLRPEWFD